jgi:hypothetical protein
MKEKIVEFEGIDLAGVQLLKARSHVLQEGQELLLVVGGDQPRAASRRARSVSRSRSS